MAFTSLNFLIFVFAVVCIYFAVPKKIQWTVLLAGSYVFYLLSSPRTFVFILFTTVVTFFGGQAIGKKNTEHKNYIDRNADQLSREEKKEAKAQVQKKKRSLVVLILIVNFGVLAVVKYFRYYIEALGIAGIHFDSGVLIPLGISFYTFQSVAYIIDLYRNKFEADQNIFKFALFVSFFPQIIQGPISRYDQLAGQLYAGHTFNYQNLSYGAQLILWGFLKKLVIADRVGIFVNEVFDNYTEYVGFYVAIALLLYSIQIYADFSGGIDIARGVAQILGIEMVNNFERPYFSDSISEFWRRWHITLGNWCRDYIFYPISLSKTFGKAGKKLRSTLGDRLGKLFPVLVAQMATFLTIGLWHGAEFKYIAYGLYNGGIIIMGLVLKPYLDKLIEILRINTKTFSWRLFQILRTFFLIVIGRLLPKAVSFTAAISMFKSLCIFNPGVIFNGSIYQLGLTEKDIALVFLFCTVWFVISLMQENGWKIRESLARQNILFRWGVYLAAIVAVFIFGIYGPGYDASAFIYRGF
ncbi:MBOAT family protein [Ihubacter massiliensis]|uniref:MBOAT family O-acyltransferase n=1 Tax=Ihubacter massiliensis TaxID=1852367 RepID=UPI001D0F7D1F|nr:MBOAT family O-acyltransferase [Ihubacter massiliensis]MCO7123778.1 MBOAT family protein [Ihubacter massiliensis]